MLKNFEHKINENKKNYTFFKLWEKAFIEYKIMNSFILNIHKAIKYDIKDFSSECPICFEGFNETNNKIKLKCGHAYHIHCMIKLLIYNIVYKCPICRSHDIFLYTDNVYNRYFQFFAFLHNNMMDIERCFNTKILNFEKNLSMYINNKNLTLDPYYEIMEIRKLLIYISLNKEGITYLLKKFDQETNANIFKNICQINKEYFIFWNEAIIYDDYGNEYINECIKNPYSKCMLIINKIHSFIQPKQKSFFEKIYFRLFA